MNLAIPGGQLSCGSGGTELAWLGSHSAKGGHSPWASWGLMNVREPRDRESLRDKDKDQSGSVCSFRADFYFPLWWRSRFRTAFKHNMVSSKEEMKPFKSSALRVVPSPAALGLTEAFCYSPRNVYLIEKAWFCGCWERTPSGVEQTCLSKPDGGLCQGNREIHQRPCFPSALPKVQE